MNAKIRSAAAHHDYTVEIVWSDGTSSTVDFSSTVAKGGVFQPLKDRSFFEGRLRIGGEGDWLEWPGGVDFSADSLWYRSHPDEEIPEKLAAGA